MSQSAEASPAGKTRTQVCLIIPVYNEVENIAVVIEEIKALADDERYTLQIMVVDGGSKDGTTEAARQTGAEVVRQRGKGYGSACFTGFEEAVQQKADILVYLDGDYSDPPASVPALLQPLLTGEADMVLGVRHFEKGTFPFHAILGNRLVAGLIRLFYGKQYHDLPSFKAIRPARLADFNMQEMSYGWTTEMLVKAARSKCRVVEVPVQYRRRGGGQSKVSGTLNGSAKAAYFLIKTALKYVRWRPN